MPAFPRCECAPAGRAAEREGCVGLSKRHFEANHRGPVFLLERLHYTARLHDDYAQRAALQFGAARDDRFDDAIGLLPSVMALMMSLCLPARCGRY